MDHVFNVSKTIFKCVICKEQQKHKVIKKTMFVLIV